ERLAEDAWAGRPQMRWRGNPPRCHPRTQRRVRETGFGRDDVELRQTRLVGRAMTEIAIHGSDQVVFVLGGQSMQALHAIAPRREVWKALACECAALQGEEARKLTGGSRVQGVVHRRDLGPVNTMSARANGWHGV